MSLMIEKNLGQSISDCNPSVTMVQYDFEQYALEHGIPETLDPLVGVPLFICCVSCILNIIIVFRSP